MQPVLLLSLSALLYAASFPPLSLYPLAWIALVPFFLACASVRPLRAAVYGLLWGVMAAYGVAWWLPNMVAAYLKVSLVTGWGCFFGVSLGFAGVYFAGFAWWLSWMAHQRRLHPWRVAAGWGVCEFARATVFLGNPWALIGYSQIPLTPLVQIADVTGVYGIGMIIAAVNACLAGCIAPPFYGRRPLRDAVGVLCVLLLLLGYGEWRLAQTFTVGEPVPITVVQGAIGQPFRWNKAYRRRTWRVISRSQRKPWRHIPRCSSGLNTRSISMCKTSRPIGRCCSVRCKPLRLT